MHEAYKLECHRCKATVEIPAGDPNRPEQVTCPRCGAVLAIEWRRRRRRRTQFRGFSYAGASRSLALNPPRMSHPTRYEYQRGVAGVVLLTHSAGDRVATKFVCVQVQSFLGGTE